VRRFQFIFNELKLLQIKQDSRLYDFVVICSFSISTRLEKRKQNNRTKFNNVIFTVMELNSNQAELV